MFSLLSQDIQNIIVFDLEWNQCCGGRDMENPRMPFEIIEIGAVKLDKKFNIIDTYSSIIKPKLYKKLQQDYFKL